jgi:hypothetical protein
MTFPKGRISLDASAVLAGSRMLEAEAARLAAVSDAVSTATDPSRLRDDGGALDDPLREAFEQCFVGPAAATMHAAKQLADNLTQAADNIRRTAANLASTEHDSVQRLQGQR